MASLAQIAEQARRIYSVAANVDSAKRQREFELHAQQALGWIIRLNYFNENSEGERKVNEVWLKPYQLTAEQKNGIWQICLPVTPVDLPNDIGVYRIAPSRLFAGEYRKSTKSLMSFTGELPSLLTKRYYRLNRVVYFPDGLLGEVKEIEAILARAPDIECDEPDLVPDDYAGLVIQQIGEILSNPKQVNSTTK